MNKHFSLRKTLTATLVASACVVGWAPTAVVAAEADIVILAVYALYFKPVDKCFGCAVLEVCEHRNPSCHDTVGAAFEPTGERIKPAAHIGIQKFVFRFQLVTQVVGNGQ